jgi:Ribbon-helix-helix protein, copG family
MAEGRPTSVRLTDEDKKTIARLEKLTGVSGVTRVIRMALREALAIWEKKRPKK